MYPRPFSGHTARPYRQAVQGGKLDHAARVTCCGLLIPADVILVVERMHMLMHTAAMYSMCNPAALGSQGFPGYLS